MAVTTRMILISIFVSLTSYLLVFDELTDILSGSFHFDSKIPPGYTNIEIKSLVANKTKISQTLKNILSSYYKIQVPDESTENVFEHLELSRVHQNSHSKIFFKALSHSINLLNIYSSEENETNAGGAEERETGGADFEVKIKIYSLPSDVMFLKAFDSSILFSQRNDDNNRYFWGLDLNETITGQVLCTATSPTHIAIHYKKTSNTSSTPSDPESEPPPPDLFLRLYSLSRDAPPRPLGDFAVAAPFDSISLTPKLLVAAASDDARLFRSFVLPLGFGARSLSKGPDGPPRPATARVVRAVNAKQPRAEAVSVFIVCLDTDHSNVFVRVDKISQTAQKWETHRMLKIPIHPYSEAIDLFTTPHMHIAESSGRENFALYFDNYIFFSTRKGEPETHFFDKKAHLDSKIALSVDDKLMAIYDAGKRVIQIYVKNREKNGSERTDDYGAYKTASNLKINKKFEKLKLLDMKIIESEQFYRNYPLMRRSASGNNANYAIFILFERGVFAIHAINLNKSSLPAKLWKLFKFEIFVGLIVSALFIFYKCCVRCRRTPGRPERRPDPPSRPNSEPSADETASFAAEITAERVAESLGERVEIAESGHPTGEMTEEDESEDSDDDSVVDISGI